MKSVAFAVMALLAVGAAAARPMVDVTINNLVPVVAEAQTEVASLTSFDKLTASYPFCGICVQFAVSGLNILANAILNDGVVTGCSDLCHHLDNKIEVDVCEGLCLAVGIGGFVEILEHSGLDFIYYCELVSKTGLDICPIQDCPANDADCVTIGQDASVAPAVGPVGTQFELTVTANATAPTGTGMIRTSWTHLGDGSTGGADQLYLGFAVGITSFQVEIDSATAGKDDDGQDGAPMAQGDYEFAVMVCEGSCPATGEHPHQQNFGSATGKFTIKGGPPPAPPSPFAPLGPMPGPTPGPQ